MDFQIMDRKYKGARRLNVVLVLFGAALTCAVVFLSFHIVRETNQVVLVPSQISDGMVARGGVDQRYVEAIALDAAYAMYNVSAANLKYGRDVIERVSSNTERNRLLTRYDEIGEDIRLRKISTTFRPNNLQTDMDNLTVVLNGELSTYLENTRTSVERRTLLVTFAYEGASVRVASIAKLEDQS